MSESIKLPDHDDLTIRYAVPEDRPLLEKLLQLYLHDFSEFAELDSDYGELNEQGVFEYPHLDTYWNGDAGRRATLFLWRDRIAGFALINTEFHGPKPADRSIAEFFILRKYRRAGVGKAFARHLILADAVRWEIAVAWYNRPAIRFWAKAMEPLTRTCHVNSVDSRNAKWSGPIYNISTR